VQCKWAQRKGNVIPVHLSTCRHTPGGYVRSTYGREEIDGIGVYCHELKRCFYICRSKRWPVGRRSAFVWRLLRTTRKPR
jgi:hypothetical protein